MKRLLIVIIASSLNTSSPAQNISQRIGNAYRQFEADSQLRHATVSLYVINAKTGEVVFDKNSQTGLAPASTQKIITAVTAFEFLGKDYRYKTSFIIRKNLHRDGYGELLVSGDFDPSFGSNRYADARPAVIFTSVLAKLKAGKYTRLDRIATTQYVNQNNPIPGGYIWDDIGNYYGAGVFSFNWRENQYDMLLRSADMTSGPPEIIGTDPPQRGMTFYNFLTTGSPGSGDNAYIYSVPFSKEITVRGTIPPNENKFVIAGSMSNPAKTFSEELYQFLSKNNVSFPLTVTINKTKTAIGDSFFVERDYPDYMSMIRDAIARPPYTHDTIYNHYSPALDSIIYWFLRKSINLYGEALVKTFSNEANQVGNTDTGVDMVKQFWKQKGIDETELNISDGSGLSPQNRVTTHAQVEILKYAKTREWFPYFYDALPTYNGMKMKSGSIRDVKGYCGYQKSGDGNEYIFSFLINNYNGSSSGVVNKMYQVLDVLK